MKRTLENKDRVIDILREKGYHEVADAMGRRVEYEKFTETVTYRPIWGGETFTEDEWYHKVYLDGEEIGTFEYMGRYEDETCEEPYQIDYYMHSNKLTYGAMHNLQSCIACMLGLYLKGYDYHEPEDNAFFDVVHDIEGDDLNMMPIGG